MEERAPCLLTLSFPGDAFLNSGRNPLHFASIPLFVWLMCACARACVCPCACEYEREYYLKCKFWCSGSFSNDTLLPGQQRTWSTACDFYIYATKWNAILNWNNNEMDVCVGLKGPGGTPYQPTPPRSRCNASNMYSCRTKAINAADCFTGLSNISSTPWEFVCQLL